MANIHKEIVGNATPRLVDPNSLVRFMGYEPHPGVPDEQFINAWRTAVEQIPIPTGLVYRELCRQVPEWNEPIIAMFQNPNIQNPTPFTFIDYAVVRPDADPAALPTIPNDIATQYKRVEGTYQIVYRVTRPENSGEPATIFYNLFQIDGAPAVEQGFVNGWPVRANFQSQQEGFFSAILHRRTEPMMPIAAFNRGEWLTATAFANTIAEFDRQFPVQGRIGGSSIGRASGASPVRGLLGLFRIVARIEG